MWPLAIADILRDGENATRWSRLHARQAAVFGAFWTIGYTLVLAAPLAIVIAQPAISTAQTVLIYGIGLAVDLIIGTALFATALRYSGKAGRGELFSIPLVTPVADRFLRVER